MVLSLKQAGSMAQLTTRWRDRLMSANTVLVGSLFVGVLGLSACQTAPSTSAPIRTAPVQTVSSSSSSSSPSSEPTVTTTIVTQAPVVRVIEEDNTIDPFNSSELSEEREPQNPLTEQTPVFTPPITVSTPPDEIIVEPSRNDYIISEPSVPSHNELLEHARRNSQQRTQQSASNNSNLPAFRNLMQMGVSQLKSGKLTNAESSFTRAQRLAPKSSAVYFYLAQVALKKNQPHKAEAMARRGLSVSQDTRRRRALWQIILQSGQAQGNSRVISEARQALR